jgi:K+-transporting ATPase ATPase C chain
MMRSAIIAIRFVIVTLVITGIIYPLAMTGLANVAFPDKSSGSLIKQEGQVIGSKYIGQQFSGPQYFHPRPSAAGSGYDAMDSGGSNLGPTSATLIDRVRDAVAAVVAEDPGLAGHVPVDMVTASGSGLDPDITPANAEAQVARVAAARNMGEDEVRRLVAENTHNRDLGFLGEKRVNVLELNLALDKAQSAKSQ